MKAKALPSTQSTNLKTFILLAAILLLAAGLRFYMLGEWSLWQDEAFTLSGYEDGFNFSLFRRSLASDLIQAVAPALGNTEWAARLVPALIGILSLPVLFFPIKKLWGRGPAIIVSALLAVSPWHIYWSQNARFYTLLLLFYTLGLLAFHLALEEDRPLWMLAALLLFGLAARERLIAFLGAPVLVAYVALLWLLPFPKPPGLRGRTLLIFFGPAAIIALVYIWPYLMNLGGWMAGFGFANNDPLWLGAGMFYYIGMPVVCTAAIGVFNRLFHWNRSALLFVLGAAIPPAFLMLISPIHYTAIRYAFISLTSILILAGLAVWDLYHLIPRSRVAYPAGLLALLLLGSLSEDYLYFQYQNGNRENWKAAYAFVEQRLLPGDVLVTPNDSLDQYYYSGETLSIFQWEPNLQAGTSGRTWVLVDSNVESSSPEKAAWLAENAEEVANLDVHANARNFLLRIYLIIPQPEQQAFDGS